MKGFIEIKKQKAGRTNYSDNEIRVAYKKIFKKLKKGSSLKNYDLVITIGYNVICELINHDLEKLIDLRARVFKNQDNERVFWIELHNDYEKDNFVLGRVTKGSEKCPRKINFRQEIIVPGYEKSRAVKYEYKEGGVLIFL